MTLLFDSTPPTLAIPQAIHTTTWQNTQSTRPAGLRLQAYLNAVCLQTLIPWLEEEWGEPVAIAFPHHPGLGELVNGCALTVGDLRVIVIPTEAMDREELRVPQEWIDLPNWVGDYYLAVEVDTDEQAIAVWGYATQAQIKTTGEYDAGDRSYALAGRALIPDLSVLRVMRQLGTEATRAPLEALVELTEAEAEALIEQAADPELVLPRLAGSFGHWSAILNHADWVQRLCERRSHPTVPEPAPAAVMTQLGQWLQNQFEASWQAMETLFQPELTPAFNFRREDATDTLIQRARWVQVDAVRVRWVVMVGQEDDGRSRIVMQVFPAPEDSYLPPGLALTLQTLSGETIQSVQASATSQSLRLKPFRCASGTSFHAQFSLGDRSITESMMA